MSKEIMDAALNYAAMGWAVFPVSKNKNPLTKNGCLDASKDPEVIKAWFTKYTGANVAIATGAVSGGLTIIDIDFDDDECKDGFDTFNKWMDANGCYIDSKSVTTGRGGRHIYLTSTEPFGNKVGAMKDIDIRGDGGYVVAPPSIHMNGREYFWDDEEQEIVSVQSDSDVEFFLHECFKSSPKNKPLEIKKEVVTGSRNDSIFKIAASYQAKGNFTDDEILAFCKTYNAMNCNPPLPDDELERTVKSALRYEKGTAKTVIKNTETVNDNGSKTFTRETVSRNGKKTQEEVTEADLEMPSVDEIEECEIEWLIPGFIPRGCITFLSSDGGIGKTSLWCDTLAKITTGQKSIFEMKGIQEDNVPFGAIEGEVMYFSKEDPTNAVLKPKLKAAGANLKKIKCFGLDDDRVNNIWYGSLLLDKLVEKYRPAVVVFDTLQSFLPDGIDIAKRNEVRNAMTPLNQLGAKYGTTFWIICHTNKSSNSGRNRMADSSDFWDIARSVLMAGETNEENVYYLSHEKCNYGRLQKTILFSHSNDNKIEFKGLTKKKDRDFQGERQVSHASPKTDEAKDFILEQLEGAPNHIIEIKALIEVAKAAGIKEHTLEDARSELVKMGVIKRKNYGAGDSKKWYLLLPPRNDAE